MLFPNITVTEKDICDDSRLMMAFKQDKLKGSVGKHLVYGDGYFNEKRVKRETRYEPTLCRSERTSALVPSHMKRFIF